MFCARCGRQIDGQGRFCPFCGQQMGVPVSAVPSDGRVAANDLQTPGKKNKKAVFIGIAALAVIGVVVAVKPFGRDKTEEVRTEKASRESRKEADEKGSTRRKRNLDEMSDGADAKQKEKTAEEQVEETEPEDIEEKESDTVFESLEDEEILEVLSAYQEYANKYEGMGFEGYTLAYLDEDDIPELIANGDCEAVGHAVITYQDGELTENYVGRLGGLSYVEKQNFYWNSNGHMGVYYDEFYQLVDGEQTVIASGEWGDKYDEEGNIVWNEAEDYPEQEYAWNGEPCSEEEYYEAIDEFIEASVGDAEFCYHSYWGDQYMNMLDAYESLQYKRYAAYWPQIEKFELQDGVLTYKVRGGGYYNWGSNDDPIFAISCPIAPDCIWEQRGVGMGEHCEPQVGDTDYICDTTYEEIRKWIDDEKAWFEEAAAEFGRDEAWVESPVNVVVVVKGGVVVRVYTVSS